MSYPRCSACNDSGGHLVEVDYYSGPEYDVCPACEEWPRWFNRGTQSWVWTDPTWNSALSEDRCPNYEDS